MNMLRDQGPGEFEEEYEFEAEGEGGPYGGRFRHRRFDREVATEFENEAQAAEAFLGLNNEEELEQFLPLLLGAIAPMLLKMVGPVLQGIGSRVLSGVNAPPAQGEQQEGFLFGKLLGGLFHEQEQEAENYLWNRPGYWGHHRWEEWRRPGVFFENENEGEQEGFLSNILGGLFGEIQGLEPHHARRAAARWYVRLVRRSADYASRAMKALTHSGHPVNASAVRRIVYEAVRRAHHSLSSGDHGDRSEHRGHGAGSSHHHSAIPSSGRWFRRGSKLIVSF